MGAVGVTFWVFGRGRIGKGTRLGSPTSISEMSGMKQTPTPAICFLARQTRVAKSTSRILVISLYIPTPSGAPLSSHPRDNPASVHTLPTNRPECGSFWAGFAGREGDDASFFLGYPTHHCHPSELAVFWVAVFLGMAVLEIGICTCCKNIIFAEKTG